MKSWQRLAVYPESNSTYFIIMRQTVSVLFAVSSHVIGIVFPELEAAADTYVFKPYQYFVVLWLRDRTCCETHFTNAEHYGYFHVTFHNYFVLLVINFFDML